MIMRKRFRWLLSLAGLVAALTVAQAQETAGRKVSFSLITQEAVTEVSPQDRRVRRIVIERGAKAEEGAQATEVGALRMEAERPVIARPDRPQVALPYRLDTLVSRDGNTILQYGDEVNRIHQIRTDLHWLNAQGQEIGSLVNHYGGNALVDLSEDGFTAVAGKLLQRPEETVVGLYSPRGERIWETSLPRDRRAAEVRAGPRGERVALLTTDAGKWLTEHRIEIRGTGGQVTATIPGLGVLQKSVVLDGGDHLFVQGYDAYHLVRLSTGERIWTRAGTVRMVSPRGAAIGPSRDVLFLLLADWEGKSRETYRWRLVGVDAASGQTLGEAALPEDHPSTWDEVFEQVSANRIQVLTERKRLTYSWDR